MISSSDQLASHYLADVLRSFRNYKKLGDAALDQVPGGADLHKQLDPESNSIAVIIKHLAGNFRSRFTDFLTTDGEKPDRDRDGEFEMPVAVSREDLLALWEAGWAVALGTIEGLRPEDLTRTVTIRGEPFSVVEALNRLVTHTAYHVGQMVYVARHLAWPNWRSLSIPKGKSREAAAGTFKQSGLTRQP